MKVFNNSIIPDKYINSVLYYSFRFFRNLNPSGIVFKVEGDMKSTGIRTQKYKQSKYIHKSTKQSRVYCLDLVFKQYLLNKKLRAFRVFINTDKVFICWKINLGKIDTSSISLLRETCGKLAEESLIELLELYYLAIELQAGNKELLQYKKNNDGRIKRKKKSLENRLKSDYIFERYFFDYEVYGVKRVGYNRIIRFIKSFQSDLIKIFSGKDLPDIPSEQLIKCNHCNKPLSSPIYRDGKPLCDDCFNFLLNLIRHRR